MEELQNKRSTFIHLQSKILNKCQITNSVECCHSKKSHQQKETNTFVKSAMKGQISPGYRLFDQNILQPGM